MSVLICCHELPHRPSDGNDDNELSGPDITEKNF